MMSTRIKLHKFGPEFSRIIAGMMRLNQWKMTAAELKKMVSGLIESGFTTFDHADIYGKFTCEKIFGELLREEPSLRNKIELITKCGVKPVFSGKGQEIPYYDLSGGHIIASVENSLEALNTEVIDLLLLHRPDVLFNPEETASAFEKLYSAGKVKYFGVSNFTPAKFNMMQKYSDYTLVTNQVEFSPLHPEPLYDGLSDHALEAGYAPMAWSPLGGGRIFNAGDERSIRVKAAFEKLLKKYEVSNIDVLVYAWILKTPCNFLPVTGSGNADRIKAGIKALEIDFENEDYYKVLKAYNGFDVV